ncbi:triphosphate tunel metalloenzyme 3 [Phtheirospermum japonicum]|uniref:Triphosphate tunel metalloenzyme 3 n=1 Tax=Phtheirospermum japonicum TaxID=374723 RepID=A0A830C8I7_9LAMI|nr:triphosphate tunel metalloenzyme 3 [Phtheirospermum japonicum]
MGIEVKLRLPSSAAHEHLSAVLSPYHRRTHFQENLFFDGPNAELVSNLAALRLRFYDLDSPCVLSLRSKPRISGGISRIKEQEEDLDPAVGLNCAASSRSSPPIS